MQLLQVFYAIVVQRNNYGCSLTILFHKLCIQEFFKLWYIQIDVLILGECICYCKLMLSSRLMYPDIFDGFEDMNWILVARLKYTLTRIAHQLTLIETCLSVCWLLIILYLWIGISIYNYWWSIIKYNYLLSPTLCCSNIFSNVCLFVCLSICLSVLCPVCHFFNSNTTEYIMNLFRYNIQKYYDPRIRWSQGCHWPY